MRSSSLRAPPRALSVQSIVLALFMSTLWVAGGSSQNDVWGQVVVQLAAVVVLILVVLLRPWPESIATQPVAVVLMIVICLPILQLIPLPPSWWEVLPGRSRFNDAVSLSGNPRAWRPAAIVPGAAASAAYSFLVPLAAFMLVQKPDRATQRWLPRLMILLFLGSALLGFLQFSGQDFQNPFIGNVIDDVSGSFTNRNHFALFMALGCLMLPAVTFSEPRRSTLLAAMSAILSLFFIFMILASGSRAGLILGTIAITVGLALAYRPIRAEIAPYPRWLPSLLTGLFVLTIASAVFLSIAADRAVSINRAIALDPGQDLRRLALPTLWRIIYDHFPVGAGVGSFDPVFRIYEPFGLLHQRYFNLAHNDWLQIIFDAGLPGLALLAFAVAWWLWASIRALRSRPARDRTFALLGSAILGLIMVASFVDYPIHAPIMMAITVVAAVWLNGGWGDSGDSPLRDSNASL